MTYSANVVSRWIAVGAGLLAISALHAQSPAPEDSSNAGVRIVRLSETRGEVKMDRNVGHGFEAAFQNLPIVQGAKLKTDQGVAEVEFEDNSTLRLTPDAVVEFSKLSRDTAGNTVTSVNVLHGTVYASLSDATTNTFVVNSAQGRLTLAPSTHMQFNTGPADSTLAVYKGSVQAQVGSSLMTVEQKKTLSFGPAGVVQPQLASHVEKGAYDDWDKTSVDYHKRYMSSFQTKPGGYTAVSGVSSGLSDLNYYGSFSDAGGCGNMWRPYFAGASFDPYANGTYAQYAGGYSWVSPYPWGWLPYHSGSWEYCAGGQGGGSWGWRPGNTYVGLANTLLPIKPKQGPVRTGPPHPPVLGTASLVHVERQPVVASKMSNDETFVFAKGSAGLGVPRQTFGNLQHASMHAEHHGSASSYVSSSTAEYAGLASSAANRSFTSSSGRVNSSAGRSSGSSGFSSTASPAGASHSSGGFGGGMGGGASAAGGSSHR